MSSDATATHISWDGTRTPLKTALFLVVCVTWLLPGLVGHDPWKYDEAVVFGIVTEILRTGDWITFRIAGEPFFGKAPLFVWTAALFAKAMGGVLTLHDAARLAAGVYMALTMLFVSRAGHELLGERGIRVSVLLLIGCLGLLVNQPADAFATQEHYDGFLGHLDARGVTPGTIIIDDRWQAAYGTGEVDPAKRDECRDETIVQLHGGHVVRVPATLDEVLAWFV